MDHIISRRFHNTTSFLIETGFCWRSTAPCTLTNPFPLATSGSGAGRHSHLQCLRLKILVKAFSLDSRPKDDLDGHACFEVAT